MAKQIMLYYGWQNCGDNGIFHAFEAAHAEGAKNKDMEHILAEALEVDAKDPDFNWDCMHIRLPDSTVDEIKEEAIRDFSEREGRVLLLLNFKTGDPDVLYFQIPVVVNATQFDSDELADCFCSYNESSASEDKSFEEAAEEVLNSMNWEWRFVSGGIPACKSIYTMYI